jgi:hypothetical protein
MLAQMKKISLVTAEPLVVVIEPQTAGPKVGNISRRTTPSTRWMMKRMRHRGTVGMKMKMSTSKWNSTMMKTTSLITPPRTKTRNRSSSACDTRKARSILQISMVRLNSHLKSNLRL